MKKILVAALAMSATSAMAAPEIFSAGTITTKEAVATTYTYQVSDTPRADRLFVKNDFDFTLSANVLMNAGEDADGRFMIVGTGNAQGRNVYVGHSDGGSVTSCGDPLTAEQAKVADAISGEIGTRVVFDGSDANANGCGEDD